MVAVDFRILRIVYRRYEKSVESQGASEHPPIHTTTAGGYTTMPPNNMSPNVVPLLQPRQDPLADVGNTLSSWDSCMAETYW